MSNRTDIEKPARGPGDCPFQEGLCVGNKCHLWVEKEQTEDESIGNCVFVKSYNQLQSIDMSLNIVVAIILVVFIILLVGTSLGVLPAIFS